MDALSSSLRAFSLTRALHIWFDFLAISAEVHYFLIRKKSFKKMAPPQGPQLSALEYFFIQSEQQTKTLHTDCVLFTQQISLPCLPEVRPAKSTEDKTASMTQSLFSQSLESDGEDSQLHCRVTSDRMDITMQWGIRRGG